MAPRIVPTQREVHFGSDQLIVSKTDLKGKITYANSVFCNIAGYREDEVVGQPHSLIRHPDMPRSVFRLLWETIQDGREMFAYVKNMARNGDHYWVFAHVTPSFDPSGAIVGYHSNRRVPDRSVLDRVVVPLYAELKRAEAAEANGKAAVDAGYRHLLDFAKSRKTSYDEMVFTL